jgi:hypothetical protein
VLSRDEVLGRIGPVWTEFLALGDVACAWGQGSVVSGFAESGDIDVVVAWRDTVPAREQVLRRFHDSTEVELSYVHRPPWHLDRVFCGAEELNFAHHQLGLVEHWIRRPATDPRQLAWDLNNMGFLNGILHGVPLEGEALVGDWMSELRSLPTEFVAEAREKLQSRCAGAVEELRKAARRQDRLVYFHLLVEVVRDAMIHAFAAAGSWYPSDKWLVRWATDAGVDPTVLTAYEAVWAAPAGPSQVESAEALIAASLTQT